jgi:hypothetical protein
MIKELVRQLSAEIEIELSLMQFVSGDSIGCIDGHLLRIAIGNDHIEDVLVHDEDLERLQIGESVELLAMRIRSALLKLKMQ